MRGKNRSTHGLGVVDAGNESLVGGRGAVGVQNSGIIQDLFARQDPQEL